MGPGAQNGIVGDEGNYGTDLPVSQSDDEAWNELQKTAKFSKTAEFKELKAHFKRRIAFYKKNLPGGQPVKDVDPAVVGPMWIAANTIIDEFEAVISVYEQAAQAVKDENTRRKEAQRVR